jgi:hypothetical protein
MVKPPQCDPFLETDSVPVRLWVLQCGTAVTHSRDYSPVEVLQFWHPTFAPYQVASNTIPVDEKRFILDFYKVPKADQKFKCVLEFKTPISIVKTF